MIKDEIPRGQLSTIILMTLLERDKYGYEIIDEVLKSTNGKVSIKQPSLYSSLKRMEDQAIITSYWRDSDIGGRRHYYHLTDLGKKHLEKWQNDLPKDYLTPNNNQSEPETKLLQQENLFNLNTTPKQEESKTEQLETKKDDTFVQFDLFSNSIIVTPPSSEEIQSAPIATIQPEPSTQPEPLIQNVSSTPQNPILTSYEKPLEKNEHTFEYVKKTNKSFSEALNDSSTYQKKYIEEIKPVEPEPVKETITVSEASDDILTNTSPNNNEVNNSPIIPLEKQEESQQSADNLISSTEEPETNTHISISELKGYIPKDATIENKEDNVNKESVKVQEQKKDDGVLITERLNPEDMPKPTKWDTRRFEIYVNANSIAPDLKSSKTSDNYKDRVKDLYEQSKTSAENQELEVIDSKTSFATYSDLQSFYSSQNIKFKPFVKELKKTSKDYNMVKISKLNSVTSLLMFSYISLITIVFAVIFSFIKNVHLNHPVTYIIFPIIALLIFGINYINYKKAPHKCIALDLTKFKFNAKFCAISLLAIPIIFAINLMCGFSFENFTAYSLTLLYPITLSFSYIVFHFVRKLLLKSKLMYQ